MSINPQQVKNILVVRNDRFGEFLLNIPAFRALRETYPQAKITVAVAPYVKELAGCIDGIDEVITWENKRHSLFKLIKFSRQLKSAKFDLCVIFNPSRDFNLVSFLAGIPMRVGYARKWPFLLTHKIKDEKYLGLKHEIEYNLELVNCIGADTKDKSLSLKIDNGAIDALSGYFKDAANLVAIHPFTSDPIKQWPLNNFRELANRLKLQFNTTVVIIAGEKESIKNRDFLNRLDSGIINLSGKTTLVQLAALLKKCRLLVSGDSGPVHLACAVNTPVIAIFRNDIPGKTAKRWGPWHGQSRVIEKNDLSKITVDEVFKKVKEVVG